MDEKVLKGYTSSGSWGLARLIARGGMEDPGEGKNECIYASSYLNQHIHARCH